MDWTVYVDQFDQRTGRLDGPGGYSALVALGKGGVKPERDKREGDGATPLGTYQFRRALFRPDRMEPPLVSLPLYPIAPDMAWCDDPEHAAYNQQVRLPFGPSHESLWREDHLYDLMMVISHNDEPVVPHLGSAIFVHCAYPDYRPTDGCVALLRSDLTRFMRAIGPRDQIIIKQD